MNGTHLRFYLLENRRHQHILLYEWLLQQAKNLGIHGGTALRAIAGFGRHGVIHEQHFYELAGELAVEVEFLLSDADADKLLELIRRDKVSVVYSRAPVEIGVTYSET